MLMPSGRKGTLRVSKLAAAVLATSFLFVVSSGEFLLGNKRRSSSTGSVAEESSMVQGR
jgi:hypothetical protein